MSTLRYLVVMVGVLVMWIGRAAAPCQNIQLEGYKFTLEKLKEKSSEIATANSNIVKISLCKLQTCTDHLNNIWSGYALTESSVCASYTANQTGPFLQSYQLINKQSPKQGISFSYVPKAYAIIQNNTAVNHLNSFTVKLHCNQVKQGSTNCSLSSGANNERFLSCQMYLTEGCPVLAVNHFWTFLIDRAIIFAIVIWICGLFLIILGYLAIRVTILLYGILTGAFFGIIFVAQSYTNFYLESTGIFVFVICVSVLMGFLFGISLLTVPKIGYINIGVIVAAMFSLLLQNSVLYLTGSLLAFYITFGVSALGMAVVALMQLRYFIMICSSFTGAFLLIRPLGFFLPGYPNQLISGKNFLISVSTPWQFYLFLASILILTGIGIAIQKCINDKVGKVKVNSHYYLEQDGSVRDKLKKIFEFKQIKQMVKAGKKQIIQLKNMITDDKNTVHFTEQFGQEEEIDHGHYIQMEKMEKIQNKNNKQKKQMQSQKVSFIKATGKKQKQSSKRSRNQSQEVDSVDLKDQLESINDSQDEKPTKYVRNKKK